MKINLQVVNADLKIGGVKINSVSTSSIVIFGDAECFYPHTVAITRGAPVSRPATAGPGGPVGAIR
jgi:hypothetical protein